MESKTLPRLPEIRREIGPHFLKMVQSHLLPGDVKEVAASHKLHPKYARAILKTKIPVRVTSKNRGFFVDITQKAIQNSEAELLLQAAKKRLANVS